MFIKRIELFGFKTFAEKTEVDLSHGITAIVGPNGCGKSNISDALQWVLGESNVRNLRGQRATDVIFNGSEKRKALGVAEVTLTLDNSCGTLPISFSEVTVTRRAYRSGEAEHFINKTRCRLKDIYELFLDTGIGREAYSTISQGQIDAILSVKSEDRRELFEEAAGIKKYRYRREEAIRKLDKTEANLRRVRDIMSEIGNQLEPLREQSEQAKRYNDLTSRLREIEIGLLIRDLKRNAIQLEEVRASKEGSGDRVAALDNRIAELEAEKDRYIEKLTKLEQDVDTARRLQMNLSGAVSRLESQSALIDEKARSADSAKVRTDEEIVSLESKIAETRARIEQLRSEEQGCGEAETKLKADCDAMARELAELDARFEEASRAVNSQKASRLEIMRELTEKRSALEASRERTIELESATARLAEELAVLTSQKDEAQRQSTEAAEQVESLQVEVQKLAQEIAALTEQRTSAAKEVESVSRRHGELSRDMAGKAARLNALTELAESHEGFFEGVRSVMAAAKSGKIRGGFAVVADVLTVPKGYETAIETALAASLQDIIADTTEDAKAAISYLKETKAGRATFLPLDGIRPHDREIRGDIKRVKGVLGMATDLIEYDRKYDPAMRSLLGGVVVVDNIDNAVRVSREVDGWHRVVTVEGELIVRTGAITGGARKGKGPELLLRKQEIDQLTKEVKRLETSIESARKELEAGEQAATQLRAALTETERKFGESRIALAEQQKRVDFVSQETRRLEERIDAVMAEKTEAERARSEESSNAARLETELSAVGKEDTDLDRQVAGGEEGVEELDRQRAARREELMKLNMETASCSERLTSLRAALGQSETTARELREALEFRRTLLTESSDEVESLSEQRATISAECDRQKELLSAADARLGEVGAERSSELEKAAEIDAKLRETSSERNRVAQEAHDADVKEARLEVQVTQAVERLFEEYEVTQEQAMAWPDDIEIERGTATEVARLRREIRDMGPVNTGAIAEYDRIKERWDFLTEQRADLESAREQINSAISEIDDNTRGLFMDTFDRTAGSFDAIFKRLFNGGRAQLSLTDPNNLLDTGVDVVVQVPGKKLQDLALLSGGERALTATALIFALLSTKPSPFVVMDEVDAPLDESNVERFAEVLKDFAERSQFIVITHNRATMEAATNLYGVTVQEPGISKLISVKLTSEGPVADGVPSGELVTS